MNSTIPPQVPRLFGASGEARPLPGGQGKAFRYDNIVIKPCDDPVEWNGLAPLLSRLCPDGYRVARPVQSFDGRWVVDGWIATCKVEGTSGFAGRESESLLACRRIHQDLFNVYKSTECPSWLGSMPTIYCKAHQLAWGELLLSQAVGDHICKLLDPIVEALRPIDLPNQITHGDPGGDNILFAKKLAPAIIDISPCWRPAGYAVAIMLADGIAWEGSKPSTLELAQDEPYIGQLMLRAVIFRLTVSVFWSGPESFAKQYSAYQPVIQWALSHKG